MKKIPLIACLLGLIAMTGCVIFPGHRDQAGSPGGPGNGQRDKNSVGAGVDHGEHPGDAEHGDTMQR